MDSILSLQNIGVRYRRRTGIFRTKQSWAITDVSLDIRRGETLGIIGSNGAGKSTALRVIAGIIQPDAGRLVKFADYTASLLALQVGFVPNLSARENIFLGGMVMGMSKRELQRRFDDIVDFSELREFVDEPIMTYSVGMRARLAFAVSFQADPDILLVDEILGVGDAAFRDKSTQAMREKIRTKKTVVLVSHNEHIIQELCDRVVWIENGKTIDQGAPDRILEQYQQKARSKAAGPDRSGTAPAAPLPAAGRDVPYAAAD